jgi:hypothetical protein
MRYFNSVLFYAFVNPEKKEAPVKANYRNDIKEYIGVK